MESKDNKSTVNVRNASTIDVKCLGSARLPERKTPGSAGYDLQSIEKVIIPVGKYRGVDTGIQISIPNDLYGRIAPRSGLAAKHGIDVLAGVIDSDYRGNIKVILINHGDNDFVVNIGMSIAQLIFEKIAVPTLVQVDNLSETIRQDGGFGSTGV